MTISISGQVPAEAQNGMKALEEEWTDERTPDPIYAIVRVERDGIKFKDADQVWSATMKLTHIEPLLGDLAIQGKVLLEAACGARGGDVSTELDIPADEMSDDV